MDLVPCCLCQSPSAESGSCLIKESSTELRLTAAEASLYDRQLEDCYGRVSTITETGSYYIVKKEVFLKYNSRFGKKVINFDSDFYSLLEIDKISDFKNIVELLKTNIPKKHKLCIPNKN